MVQTFLTRTGFMAAAADLDMSRLGRQRAEAKQIVLFLDGEGPMVGNPWAYSMWDGWTEALIFYGLCICHEWRVVRGYQDSTWGWFAKKAADHGMIDRMPEVKGSMKDKWMQEHPGVQMPPWVGNRWLIRSHRSNLIGKFPMHYEDLFPMTPLGMPYFWPVQETPGSDHYELVVSRADTERVDKGGRAVPQGLALSPYRDGASLLTVVGE